MPADDEAPSPCPHPPHRISVPVNGRYTCMQCGHDVPRPRRAAARAREAWKDWTPAEVDKELEPWPRPAAAEGADLDCWSPAVPAAIALVKAAELPANLSPAARARQEGYAERRLQFPDGEFTIGPPQPLVSFRSRVDVDVPAHVADVVEVDVAAEVVNWCGLCGQVFRIAPDDPHWSTGRGPICPKPKAKP